MFHFYVLRSLKTGRRYVGSCEDLSDRVRRHNSRGVESHQARRAVDTDSKREFRNAPRSFGERTLLQDRQREM